MTLLKRKGICIVNTCLLLFLPSSVFAGLHYGQSGNIWGTDPNQLMDAGFKGVITDAASYEDRFFGGYSTWLFGSDVHENSVIFEGNVAYEVGAAGANGVVGNVNANTLDITGGAITSAYGGYSPGGYYISKNVVNISDGTVTRVYGGYSGSNTEKNIVNITGGTITSAYGGYSTNGDSKGNIVSINNGSIQNVYGGYSEHGEASHNSVYATGNITLSNDVNIYGGFGNDEVNNNLIYIDANINSDTIDSTKTLNLYTSSSNGGVLASSNNRIVIGRNAIIGNDVTLNLYSVNGDYSLYPDQPSFLEFWTKDINVNDTQMGSGAFRNMYFILPTTIQNGDTILSSSKSINIDGASIGVATQNGVNLELGDNVILIDNTYGSYQTIDMSNVSLEGGSFTTDYIFDLSLKEMTVGENALIATVANKKTNDEIKAPAEGQAASLALLNTSGDLIASAGLENAINAAHKTDGNLAVFAAGSGGYSKYKTGSYIDFANASLLTGVAKQFGKKTMAGIFVETGYGDYSTHNDFIKNTVKGDGYSKYYGLGFIGQYDLTENTYTEISMRGGYLNNHWGTNDTKIPVNYDTNSLYYGGHFGLGYAEELNKTLGLNIYGKYFYIHQEGDKAIIDNTTFDFKNINSHISRLGTQLYYTIFHNIKPFIGIAWDHEFDGNIVSYAGDIKVDTISLKGDTGMLELGLKLNNPEQSAWNIGASLQGFLGKHDGIQGLIKAQYYF